jgi:predicted anti-sigma-YlaC factor YlaD
VGWNRLPLLCDKCYVRCGDCREQLSARLDDADEPDTRAEVDAHLESCVDCAAWFDDAARITRLSRMGEAKATPDLLGAVMAKTPAFRRARLRTAVRTGLRVALAVLGVSQAILGGVQLVSHSGHHGPDVGGTSLIHISNESAAWNLALGVGFVWIAWRVSRASGLMPTLTAFVVVLTTIEVLDVIEGRVDAGRVLSHTLVQVAFVIMLALSDPRLGGGGFFPRARRRMDETRTPLDGEDTGLAGRAEDERGSDLRPTARHQAA